MKRQSILLFPTIIAQLLLIAACNKYGPIDINIQEEQDLCRKSKIISDAKYICTPLFGHKVFWKLQSDDGLYELYNITLPSDVIQDLMEAGLVEHPFYELNFLQQNHIWLGTNDTLYQSSSAAPDYIIPNMKPRYRRWIYSTQIQVNLTTYRNSYSIDNMDRALYSNHTGPPSLLLLVQGIKMGAHIRIQNTMVGTTTNQFRSYLFRIPSNILHYNHDNKITLDVSVDFDPNIKTYGRFMAASGGWDWAPYSKTCGQQEPYSSVFSFGVLQPMFIIPAHHVIITDFVTKIYYLGTLPKTPMMHGPDADFQLDVNIHLSYLHHNTDIKGNSTFFGEILLRASFLSHSNNTNNTIVIPITSPFIQYRTIVSKNVIQLWWPNRMGKQHLYTIEICYRNTWTGVQSQCLKKRIGFRTLALVTYNEYDEEHHIDPNDEGSRSHGMYFRINGAIVWCRGANLVPTHQLISHDDSYIHLAHSAVDAGMNMLRIWGGGEIPPDSFYDISDERGLLLFHDLMFVDEQGHGAMASLDVMDEVRHLTRRLSSHPSIVLWNGCNECKRNAGVSSDVYSSFVLRIVADEDDTRPIWPNSPSKLGWKTGIYTIDGRPNGKVLTYDDGLNNDKEINLESHGPYGHGWSEQFSTVNGFVNHKESYPNVIINITNIAIGPQYPNTFVSEFGTSTMSSFESMSAFFDENHWSVHGGAAADKCVHVYEELNYCEGNNSFSQRNYPCDNHILHYFGGIDLDAVGKWEFQKQLYLCMIAQLLWTKSVIETFRTTTNSYGTMVWQLNENWPTGGWGVVEYGGRPCEKGQVFGGRWKPIMHFLKQGLFKDLFSVCGQDGHCFIRNDGLFDFDGRVFVETWELTTGDSRVLMDRPISLKGSGGHEYFDLNRKDFKQLCNNKHIIMISLKKNKEFIIEEYPILCALPKEMIGLEDVDITITPVPYRNESIVEMELTSTKVALFVTVTTLLQGWFDRNSFALRPGYPKVKWHVL